MFSPDSGAHIGRSVQRFFSEIFADALKQTRRFEVRQDELAQQRAQHLRKPKDKISTDKLSVF